MMQGMRKLGQSWLGKLIVSVLFGFLILSFAIWGIGDIFRGGYGRNTVASVGSTDISLEAVRTAYQNEIQRLTREQRRAITPAEARARGIDAQVFGRLVTEASLDEYARRNGLSVSDATVIQSVVSSPAFAGANGAFDRERFVALLRENNLSEAGFLQAQKQSILRLHVAEAISGAAQPPVAMLEAIQRYGAERRSVSFMTLPATAVGDIAAPDEASLKAFYEARKNAYRAPEYRNVSILTVTPSAVAKPQDVSDADARAYYERVKAARFTTPERRNVQIVVFPNEQAARDAVTRIKAGETLEQAAGQLGVTDLGTVAAGDIFDTAVRDAAFALPEGQVSEPIAGRFGFTLARVSGVAAGGVKPFEEVAGEIKTQIAAERAQATVTELHDKIEDQRLSARPLAQIAQDLKLEVRSIQAIDAQGFDKAFAPVQGIPDRAGVLQAVFNSDVGVDNEALRLSDGGYLWFEIAAIEAARERSFDEVRATVERQWREDEVARRLSERARALVAELDKGTPFATVAQQAGLEARQATDVARTASAGLPVNVTTQIFATRVGKAGSATMGADRVVFLVEGATVPPLVRTTQEIATLETRLREAISDDYLSEFVVGLQKTYGLTVNQQALRSATGGTDG